MERNIHCETQLSLYVASCMKRISHFSELIMYFSLELRLFDELFKEWISFLLPGVGESCTNLRILLGSILNELLLIVTVVSGSKIVAECGVEHREFRNAISHACTLLNWEERKIWILGSADIKAVLMESLADEPNNVWLLTVLVIAAIWIAIKSL